MTAASDRPLQDRSPDGLGGIDGEIIGGVSRDTWGTLADPFVEGAYATVKGQVQTFVMHQQLLAHLPKRPATVLDVGGGAAHQSLPTGPARLSGHNP